MDLRYTTSDLKVDINKATNNSITQFYPLATTAKFTKLLAWFDGILQNQVILVVLDTDPGVLVARGLWSPDYRAAERALIDEWFGGYDYQVFETGGTEAPPASLLTPCA